MVLCLTLRFRFLGLGLFVALPLTLLRNIESLIAVVTASILFYLSVLLFIMLSSWSSLIDGSWISLVSKV